MKRDDRDTFVVKAKALHGNKFTYKNVNYVNSRTKVSITCKKHGDFLIIPSSLLQGRGCPSCKVESQTLDVKDFVKRAKEIHGDKYDYSKVEYVNSYTKVKIICPEHGEFLQTPKSHIFDKKGCRRCGIESSAKNHVLPHQEYVEKANQVYKNLYTYGQYHGSNKEIEITCKKHGVFIKRADSHLGGQGCPSCSMIITKWHQKLIDDISPLTKVDINNRKVLDNNYELDLYFPEAKFAVEINGVYWHSSLFKDRYYHQRKFDEAREKGIELLQLWDTELEENYDLILSMIKVRIGLVESRIPARKTAVRHVDNKTYQEFLKNNHLQGELASKVKLGLYHQDSLVSVIGFSKRLSEWHLERFCSIKDVVVTGGFSKLLKTFERQYQPEKIVTFSDGRYSSGAVYEKNGFKLEKVNQPRLYYTDKQKIYNRRNFQKPRLKKSHPEVYDDKLTEKEIAERLGFYQLWGPGTIKWTYTPGGL